MNWSEWMDFDDGPGYFGPAVYQVRLVVQGRPVPIPRLLGIDEEGGLVFGCTANMVQRYWQSL
jgi:hypothetical protein